MKIMKYCLVTITMLVVLSLAVLWAAPLGVGEFIINHYVVFIIFYIVFQIFLAFFTNLKAKNVISLLLYSSPFLDYMYFVGYLLAMQKDNPLKLVVMFIISYIIYALFLVFNYKMNDNFKELTVSKIIVQIAFLLVRVLALILIIRSGILL